MASMSARLNALGSLDLEIRLQGEPQNSKVRISNQRHTHKRKEKKGQKKKNGKARLQGRHPSQSASPAARQWHVTSARAAHQGPAAGSPPRRTSRAARQRSPAGSGSAPKRPGKTHGNTWDRSFSEKKIKLINKSKHSVCCNTQYRRKNISKKKKKKKKKKKVEQTKKKKKHEKGMQTKKFNNFKVLDRENKTSFRAEFCPKVELKHFCFAMEKTKRCKTKRHRLSKKTNSKRRFSSPKKEQKTEKTNKQYS
jgi:hypothetical protein